MRNTPGGMPAIWNLPLRSLVSGKRTPGTMVFERRLIFTPETGLSAPPDGRIAAPDNGVALGMSTVVSASWPDITTGLRPAAMNEDVRVFARTASISYDPGG